jgi:hypothetical protein
MTRATSPTRIINRDRVLLTEDLLGWCGGEQVDGNDVIAVREAVARAVAQEAGI